MKVLYHDADLENVILFRHYVYVLYPNSAVLVSAGYVTYFNQKIIRVNDFDFERYKFDFIASQPNKRDGRSRGDINEI